MRFFRRAIKRAAIATSDIVGVRFVSPSAPASALRAICAAFGSALLASRRVRLIQSASDETAGMPDGAGRRELLRYCTTWFIASSSDGSGSCPELIHAMVLSGLMRSIVGKPVAR